MTNNHTNHKENPMSKIRTSTFVAAAIAAALAGAFTGHQAAADETHVDERGEFVVVDQWRALDTRSGYRPPAGNAPAVRTGIANAQAVAVNVTVTDTGGAGYVTAWAEGLRPETSIMTVEAAGDTESAFTIVPIDAWGEFRVFVSMDAHVIVDVVGYISSGPCPFGPTGCPLPG